MIFLFLFLFIIRDIDAIGINKNQSNRYSTKIPKSELYRELGYRYLELGQRDKAIYCFKKALAYNPDDRNLYSEIGNYYDENDQWSKAIQIYHKGLNNIPGDEFFLCRIIGIYSQQGQIHKANDYLNHAEKRNIPELNILLGRLSLAQFQNNSTLMIQLGEKILTGYPYDSHALNYIAGLMEEYHQWDLAILARQILCSLEPDAIYHRIQLSDILNQTGRYREAYEIISGIDSTNSDPPIHESREYRFISMQTYYGLKNYQKLIDIHLNSMTHDREDWEKESNRDFLIQLFRTHPSHLSALLQCRLFSQPDNPEIYILLSRSYWMDDRKEAARKIMESVALKFPRIPYFNRWVLNDLIYQEKYDSAIGLARQILDENPSDSQSMKLLAELYEIRNDFGRALELYRKLLDQDKSDIGIYQSMASIYTRLENQEELDRLMVDYLSKNPNTGDIYFQAGQIYWYLDQREKAIPLMEKACQLDPGNSYYQLSYVWYLHESGRDKDMESELNRLIRITPPTALRYGELALFIDQKLNRPEQALIYYQKAVDLHPEDYYTGLAYARGLRHAGQINRSGKIYKKWIGKTSGRIREELILEFKELLSQYYPEDSMEKKIRRLNPRFGD